MFTGSTATGKKVAERAAQTLTPVGLELGGKDPMIVLRDADLEKAANAATYYSMQNGGQTCISVERVYVEEPVYDEFVRLVTEKVVGAAPGRARPSPATWTWARSRSPPQSRSWTSHVDDARREGRHGRRRRQGARGRRALLRAHGAAGRGPLDGVHDRGDVRADPADHEGRATPSRRCGWPTTPRTASRRRSGPRTPSGASRSRERLEAGRGQRERAPGELPGAGDADGRLEVVRHRHAPRRRRHPQVRAQAGVGDHPLRAASARCSCSPTPSAARR